MLSPIPLLSNLKDAMPFFFNSFASIMSELLVIFGLLPFLSVGPEPEIINTTEAFSELDGTNNEPLISPVFVLRVISSS